MRIAALVSVALATFAGEAAAAAGACGTGMWLEPAATPLPRDGRVLLEASGDVELVKAALPHVYFATSAGLIQARSPHVVEGGRLQVLLEPMYPLPPSESVHLQFGDDTLDDTLGRQAFTTSDGFTPQGLAWRAAPKVVRHVEESSNKGDGEHAIEVRVPLTDKSGAKSPAAWVLATIAFGGRTDHVIEHVSRDGTIDIGTIGCHSVYFVDRAGARTVTLTAISASGEEASAPAPITLRFD